MGATARNSAMETDETENESTLQVELNNHHPSDVSTAIVAIKEVVCGTLNIRSVQRDDLINICEKWGLSLSNDIVTLGPCAIEPFHTKPTKVFKISNDGNSLFSSLTAIICNYEKSFIESSMGHRRMRQIICEILNTFPPDRNIFQIHTGFKCNSAMSYIEMENISSFGVNGGDLEILAFCSAFNLQTAVYEKDTHCWTLIKPLEIFDSDLKTIVLQKEASHYQPVTCLCNKLTDENEDFSCGFCMDAVKFKTVRTDTHLSDQLDETSIALAEVEDANHSNQTCDVCKRNETEQYPLTLRFFSPNIIKRRKIFTKFKQAEQICLCKNCLCYCTEPYDSILWAYAWPALCFQHLVNSEHWILLPKSFKQSWKMYARTNSLSTESPAVFLDITENIKEFDRLIESYKSLNFVKALNTFCEPFVRCFCGGSEFINKIGRVDFQHLINFLQRSFVSFGANWCTKLRCIRKDYLEICDQSLPFVLRPCLFVSSDGLHVATCRTHKNGSQFRQIHIARHPLIGNLSHPADNRLAVLAPTLRSAAPFKHGKFSNTFSLSKATGGFNGVGSLVLCSNRQLNVKSQSLLPNKELLYLRKRRDMTEVVNHIADSHFLDKKMVDSFYSPEEDIPFDYEDYLSSSNYVSMATTVAIKKILDNSQPSGSKFNPLVQQCGSGTNFNVALLRPFIVTKNHSLALIHLCFANIDMLNCLLLSENSSDVSKNILQLLRKSDQRSSVKFDELFPDLSEETDCAKIFRRVFVNFSENVQLLEHNVSHLQSGFVTMPIIFWTGVGRSHVNNINELLKMEGYLCCFVSSVSQDVWLRDGFKDSAWMINLKHGTVRRCETQLPDRVKVALFIRPPMAPASAVRFVSGQSVLRCPDHGSFLCTDFAKSGYFCVLLPKCRNKSNWRCPSEKCPFALCKKHFSCFNQEACYDLSRNLERIGEAEIDDNDEERSTLSDDKIVANGCELYDFVPPVPSAECCSNEVSTDAGFVSLPVTLASEKEDMVNVPVQALFNSFLAVLNRPKHPISSCSRFKRLLQSIASKFPTCSISLLYLEAMLFPSIFYHQNEDGSFPGALPYFLFGTKSQCNSFCFEDLLSHFRTRLTDSTLLTSTSVSYIQFAIDCMINLALGKQHSQVFFRKGLQSLRLGSEKTQLFARDFNFHSIDSERRVRELSAAVAREPPTLFLTLTCNQREHPGIAPLLQKIETYYQNSTEEIKKSAMEGAMCTIVRAWSNTVELLIDFLMKSKEDVLGKITKVWGRAEFQTTAGNLPHYHVLLWLEEPTANFDELIQSAKKHIYGMMINIFNSNLQIIDSLGDLNDVTDLCFKIQSHSCRKSGYRCLKRVDEEGTKVCRTPPYPPSNCNWLMDINVQYPEAALEVMKEIGMAKLVEGYKNWFVPDGVMKCQKWMYAASQGEHIIPTNSHLFCLTKSSTNVLALTGSFVSAYLTHYITKVEEHADASITVKEDGKSFRLRSEGIVNRGISSVKHFMKIDKMRERKVEKVECSLLAVTEGVHWLFQLPDIITNLNFIHIPNVPAEDRFVSIGLRHNSKMNPITEYKLQDSSINIVFQLTHSQKTILEDILECGEAPDKIAVFGLRPPELMSVDSIGVYFRCFASEKCKLTVEEFRIQPDVPFVNCLGMLLKIRSRALSELTSFLSTKSESPKTLYLKSIVEICQNRSPGFETWLDTEIDELLPEIVFKTVSPRYVIKFLISFLLRFGFYGTELDLFTTTSLKEAYICAGLLERLESYSHSDVLKLVELYAHQDLRYQPGGALAFSAKLVASVNAFSQLLNVSSSSVIDCPTVLVSNMHAELEDDCNSFILAAQESMYEQVSQLRLQNIPSSLHNRTNSHWVPQLLFGDQQSRESILEQNDVLDKLMLSIRSRQSSAVDNRLAKNDLVLGPPGSGKSYLCRVALAYALFNGMKCFLTSLAARRSNQLGGEHIHRLFNIPCLKSSATAMAEEAVVKLSRDLKRKSFLERLDMLVIEEISVLNAETWSAMDLILQKLKGNFEPFGGIYVLANGDCCQLPTVSGTDIFAASVLLFGMNFHFLEHLVRMEDEEGKRLLKLMAQRPIPAHDVQEILDLFSENSQFVETWDEIADRAVMKVFGKKAAEREAVLRHFTYVKDTGVSHFVVQSVDEISIAGSNEWRPCQRKAINFLNRQCREPEKLMIYSKAIVRFTRNISGFSQGSLAIVDYINSSERSVSLFCARTPEDVTEEAIENEDFLSWTKRTVSISWGYTMSFKGGSVRRKQFPICNYVASNCHRLMGDGFPKMATSISETENKYSLWLPSQIFVIGSRVRSLSALIFVGNKLETLSAMRSVLSKRNLKEERIYKFFEAVKQGSINAKPAEIPLSAYMRSNFFVPKTESGFVFCLVSQKDCTYRTLYIEETEDGLSDALRKINGAEENEMSSELYSWQPWAVGFFIWSFKHEGQRREVYRKIRQLHDENRSIDFNSFADIVRASLSEMNSCVKFTICGQVDN